MPEANENQQQGYKPFGMIQATGEAYSVKKAMDEWYQEQADIQEDVGWWETVGSTLGGLFGPAAASAILGTTLGPVGIALAAGGGAYLGGQTAGAVAEGSTIGYGYDPDYDPKSTMDWYQGRQSKYESNLDSREEAMDDALLRSSIMTGAGAGMKNIYHSMSAAGGDLTLSEALFGSTPEGGWESAERFTRPVSAVIRGAYEATPIGYGSSTFNTEGVMQPPSKQANIWDAENWWEGTRNPGGQGFIEGRKAISSQYMPWANISEEDLAKFNPNEWMQKIFPNQKRGGDNTGLFPSIQSPKIATQLKKG